MSLLQLILWKEVKPLQLLGKLEFGSTRRTPPFQINGLTVFPDNLRRVNLDDGLVRAKLLDKAIAEPLRTYAVVAFVSRGEWFIRELA
jgi:hypothetical protein